jgi:hypothetical protein
MAITDVFVGIKEVPIADRDTGLLTSKNANRSGRR